MYSIDDDALVFAGMQNSRYTNEKLQRIFKAERRASSWRRLACCVGRVCQIDYHAEPIKSMRRNENNGEEFQ